MANMSTFCRYLDHTLVWRPAYLRVFNASWLAQIGTAITASEAKHSAQIGVIAEHTLPYSYLRRDANTRERALTLFGKQRFWDTEHNTGVLIYINWVERTVDIIADRGIARLVSQSQWDAWASSLRIGYAGADFTACTTAVIADMGTVFAGVLPAVAAARRNDIRDKPVVL